MKLKLVVASMSVLGLISCPALAATQHKHHHKHVAKCQTTDYKGMGGLPVQPAPVVSTVPAVDPYQVTMDAMTQNLNRQVHAGPDWFQRIGVTGGANVDFAWGNRSMGYMGENARRIAVNDLYLNTTALVSDWAKAFASISFNNAYPGPGGGSGAVVTPTLLGVNAPSQGSYPGVYSAAYTNNRIDLEQGYVTFGNFNCSPFFVQLGKQFQDFGRYTIHPMTRTLAQVMSESLQTSAKIGFVVPMGFHGSVYTFDNQLTRTNQGHTTNVWGAALGFDQPSDQLGYDLGVGYMSNITGVNDVAYAITAYQFLTNTTSGIFSTANTNAVGTYNGTVGAWNVYGDINSGPFTLGARYTTAAHSLNAFTLSNQYMNPTGSGARPWAVDVTAGYGFNAWCKNQMVYLGYQASGNAVNLYMPKNRWLVGYNIEPWKMTTLAVEVQHNTSYSAGNGVPVPGFAGGTFAGNNNSNNEIHARAGVKFG
jgi:hypothetical protein